MSTHKLDLLSNIREANMLCDWIDTNELRKISHEMLRGGQNSNKLTDSHKNVPMHKIIFENQTSIIRKNDSFNLIQRRITSDTRLQVYRSTGK